MSKWHRVYFVNSLPPPSVFFRSVCNLKLTVVFSRKSRGVGARTSCQKLTMPLNFVDSIAWKCSSTGILYYRREGENFFAVVSFLLTCAKISCAPPPPLFFCSFFPWQRQNVCSKFRRNWLLKTSPLTIINFFICQKWRPIFRNFCLNENQATGCHSFLFLYQNKANNNKNERL